VRFGNACAHCFHFHPFDRIAAGVFNFSFGSAAVAAVRKFTRLQLTVHLEIDCPDEFLEPFARAGADTILFHPETSSDPLRTIERIRLLGKSPGLALQLSIPVSEVAGLLPFVPALLLLGVPPGFGGAPINQSIFEKIRQARATDAGRVSRLEILVDGGVNLSNAAELATAGADHFVCGSYIFNGPDPGEKIESLRQVLLAVREERR